MVMGYLEFCSSQIDGLRGLTIDVSQLDLLPCGPDTCGDDTIFPLCCIPYPTITAITTRSAIEIGGKGTVGINEHVIIEAIACIIASVYVESVQLAVELTVKVGKQCSIASDTCVSLSTIVVYTESTGICVEKAVIGLSVTIYDCWSDINGGAYIRQSCPRDLVGHTMQ